MRRVCRRNNKMEKKGKMKKNMKWNEKETKRKGREGRMKERLRKRKRGGFLRLNDTTQTEASQSCLRRVNHTSTTQRLD